jgi:hypothetical protein
VELPEAGLPMESLLFIELSDFMESPLFMEPLLMEPWFIDFLCFIGFALSFFMLSLDIELPLFIESCCMLPLVVAGGVCGDVGGVDWANAAPDIRVQQIAID